MPVGKTAKKKCYDHWDHTRCKKLTCSQLERPPHRTSRAPPRVAPDFPVSVLNLLWISCRAPAAGAQSEPASQSVRSGCAGDSTKHLQPEQQPWISSRSTDPLWTARLWEKKQTVTTGREQKSRFLIVASVLSEKLFLLGKGDRIHARDIPL